MNMTSQSISEQAGGSINSTRETCPLRRHRPRPQIKTATIGRREVVFLEDMSQKQEIKRFSEESQKLLVDMNSTEIFELCENSAKNNVLIAFFFKGNRDSLLQLLEKLEVQAESCNKPEGEERL